MGTNNFGRRARGSCCGISGSSAGAGLIPHRQSARGGQPGSQRHGRPGPRPGAHRPSSMVRIRVSGKGLYAHPLTYRTSPVKASMITCPP